MLNSYLQGGDALQTLDRDNWGGQTFRVDHPFTLQWLDLNLWLTATKPEVRVNIFHAGSDHLPSGDSISLARYWLINPPFAPTDWYWYEPWGKSLTENHPWTFLNPPPDIAYYHKNGVINLINYGHDDIGISFTPLVNWPLLDAQSKHLHLSLNCPFCTVDTYATIIGFAGYFYHAVHGVMHFALYIALGAAWYEGGQYGVDPGPPWPRGWKYIGTGKHNIDMLSLWQQWRTSLGESTDPTGWELSNFHFGFITSVPTSVDRLENDYVGWYYPTTPGDPPPRPSLGFTVPFRLYRVRFSMKEVLLNPDFYYFMRVCAFPTLIDLPQYFQYDKGDATYPGGIRLSSGDGGASWTKHFNDDHLFAVFGTPPAPKPPPDPDIPHWAILDIQLITTATGMKIVVTTNVPCHLFMYWTNTEPQMHERTRILRGVSILAAPQYCFVNWTQNEQVEPGDTIIHTFYKEPWEHCETRWFTFRAETDNEWSPSVGPIFKHHRLVPPYGPEQETTYPALVADGYLATAKDNPYPTYAENWSAVLGLLDDLATALSLFNHTFMASASIYRGILFFDTTALPANAFILEAKVTLTVFQVVTDRAAILDLTPATNVHNPLITADYSHIKSTPMPVGSYAFADMPDPGIIHIPLTEESLNHITKNGITKFGARINYERSAVPNTTCYEGVRIFTQEDAQESRRPTLTIKYKVPIL